MDNNNRPRDMVYCHQCENEWFRDEHGLQCPSCHSDFVQIIEENDDPRNDEQHIPPDIQPPQSPPTRPEFYAPDPDEQDIDNLQWEQVGPDRYRLRGTYRTDIPIGQGQNGGQQAQGGIISAVGSLLQGMLGQAQAQEMLRATGGQQQMPQQPQPQPGGTRLGGDIPNSPPARPSSAPGSPPPAPRSGSGTFVRYGQGPGYSYSIQTSSSSNFGGNLFPRNANAPQPLQRNPEPIEQMFAQMLGNIGAFPGGPGSPFGPGSPGGMRMGPNGAPPHPFHNAPNGFMGPFIIGGPNGQVQGGGMGGSAGLFQLLGGAGGGQMGDAVYSQEALDRIITQLMEQHQTGNAPGPASEAAIKALPTKTISTKDLGDNGKAECSICMDEVQIGGTVTSLPCGHWFHADCIGAWLGEHDTCPHCRQGIMPKDDANSAQPREPNQAPMHDMHSPEYQRTSVPGAFPFPRQNSGGGPAGMSGDGTQQNPFTVPESPTLNRRNSTGGGERRSSAGGMFSRMRDAFGRRGSSNNGSGSQG